MARFSDLRDGESTVVTVTTTPFGVTGPAVVTAAAIAGVVGLNLVWSFAHHHVAWFTVVLVGPPAVVLAGRLWRWRSHRITVTSQRVRTESGVLARRRASYELAVVVAVHIEQRRRDRLARRGRVLLEVGEGFIPLERVRRPDALGRVIEHQRLSLLRPEPSIADDDQASPPSAGTSSVVTELADPHEDARRWGNLFGPRWHGGEN